VPILMAEFNNRGTFLVTLFAVKVEGKGAQITAAILVRSAFRNRQ